MASTADVDTEIERARTLLFAGRSHDALGLLDALIRGGDPLRRADALVLRLTALINLRRSGEYPQTLRAAFEATRAHPEPDRIAQVHALAAIVAHLEGALERCATHLVNSSRALKRVRREDADLAWAWHNLAMSYSYVGFHGHALAAMEESRRVARTAGAVEADFVVPAIRLRLAVSHDQHGDTESCLTILRDLSADLAWHRRAAPGGTAGIRPISRSAYGYGLARLGTLGVVPDADPRPLLDSASDTIRSRDLRVLGAICLAISEGRPDEALRRMDGLLVTAETLGAAELPRLRALALLAAGDPVGAYTADRQAFRVASARMTKLRDLFVDGMAARLEHESLSRSVARYQGEALTDPLTGLPNRRHLERYVGERAGFGWRVMLGVCDLDGFKQVNTVHGHLAGDLVLQRVARILRRVLRQEDFVARYGGDEFVLVLSDACETEALEVAGRVSAAVAAEDWNALVPGTPIGVTIGWAEVTRPDEVAAAFETADLVMLQAKRRPRAS
ncbi:MAG TPA: GGDEF domain-containing protein [Micromonosporaceae bacterium]